MRYTSKEELECVKYIDECLSFLRSKMNLNKFGIFLLSSLEDLSISNNDYAALFTVQTRNRYRSITVHIYPAAIKMFVKENGREKIFEALVHEMCHVITSNLRSVAEARYTTSREITNADETAVEDVANLLRSYYIEEFNKLNTKVCEVKKQPSKKVKKQVNKPKAKLAK